jgi:alpha-beta hydrolase superfamily lysophospholipase
MARISENKALQRTVLSHWETMHRAYKFVLATLVTLPLLAAGAGQQVGSGILHPMRRPLTAEQIARADEMLKREGATREDFDVSAPDGAPLRGWKARPKMPTADWVLLFHGVSDNRVGMLGHAELLLRHGYSVVMMDARAHGASEGSIATYGWKERYDTKAIADALYATEKVHCLFALGESMGAAIALQSAAVEPRIAGVVAESSFSNLREVSYDYAGLHLSPWLGKTFFRPAVWLALPPAEKEGGFKAENVSPEKAAAGHAFPLLLICGTRDHTIPCRHSRRILKAAKGEKELWVVPGAEHAGALGQSPAEFERRVASFLRRTETEDPCSQLR